MRRRAHRVRGELLTTLERRQTSADRRRKLAELGRCINGPANGNVGRNGVVHGPVVAGGKCQRCLDVAYGKTPVDIVATDDPRSVDVAADGAINAALDDEQTNHAYPVDATSRSYE